MSDKSTIYNRRHRVFSAREGQLKLNALAAAGGKPYIMARLWRAPNESDLSWHGTRTQGAADTGSVGRRDRAAIVNDAGRVRDKITQYLFKNAVGRPDINEEWSRNVTGRGRGIADFWRDVNDSLTVGQWLWLQVDRAGAIIDTETRQPRERTLLEKTRDNDFIRWQLWPSTSVPDWCLDEHGRIRWLITTDLRYDNGNPQLPPESYTVRTLWEVVDGGVRITQYKVGAEEGMIAQSMMPGLDRVPFVLIGKPTEEPWWFDDVELLQAQLLNIDSLHVENLIKTVFPQLVISAGCLQSLDMRLVEQMGQSSGEKITQLIREVVRGLDSPLVEGAEESGITRFIQPSASDLEALPNETTRKRQLLFDTTGLSLFSKETRMIQTAESKQFDQLDTESTLKNRALIMQEAEIQLVKISKLVDPLFQEYQPSWPSSFDVVDTEKDALTVQMISNMPDATPSVRKLAQLAAVRILSEMAGHNSELIDEARKEIMEADFSTPPEPRGVFDF